MLTPLAATALTAPRAGTQRAAERSRSGREAAAEFIRYLVSTPAVLLLVLAGSAPGLLDRGIALVLPSASSVGRATGIALLAPEAGALVAAIGLALSPFRLGGAAVLFGTAMYLEFILLPSPNSHAAEALVASLVLSASRESSRNATAWTRLQHMAPPGMGGRVGRLGAPAAGRPIGTPR